MARGPRDGVDGFVGACDAAPAYDAAVCGFTDEQFTPGCAPLRGCGAPLALPYFVSFEIVVPFVFLNLFVGIVLEGFYVAGDIQARTLIVLYFIYPPNAAPASRPLPLRRARRGSGLYSPSRGRGVLAKRRRGWARGERAARDGGTAPSSFWKKGTAGTTRGTPRSSPVGRGARVVVVSFPSHSPLARSRGFDFVGGLLPRI